MKCKCQTYHHRIRPCPNTGHVDGYCYLHHPEVMLAKLTYQKRAAHGDAVVPGTKIKLDDAIAEQQMLLARIKEEIA